MHEWLRNAGKDVLQRVVLRRGFIWRLAPASRGVALTFDDGPHPQYTPAVLDLLAQMQVKATFFMVGEKVDRHPEIVRRIAREGHCVAGHSYDHTVITAQSPAGLAADLHKCRDAIRRAAGVDSDLFRPPKGEVDIRSLRLVYRLGYRLVHWTKTYGDYRQDGAAPLLQRMRAQPPEPGDILLFHDHNPHTVAALAEQVPRWHESGLTFGALPQHA